MNPSDVSERLEVQPALELKTAEVPRTEPVDVSLEPEAAGSQSLDPAGLHPAGLHPAWLRLGYALEFLIALIAIITTWSEIGGEGHLELMPWYTKLGCVFGLAWCSVRFTASIVEQQRVWTPRTLRWLAGMLLFGLIMGGITYYYHLHEQPDDNQDDDNTAAAVNLHYPGTFFTHGNQRTFYGLASRFVAYSGVSGSDRISAGNDGTDSRLRL